MKPPAAVKAFFISEQRRPLHRATVNVLIEKYGAAAGLLLRAHPHMLRHACGYALADMGADTRLIQDYLGTGKFSTPSAIPPAIRRAFKGSGSGIINVYNFADLLGRIFEARYSPPAILTANGCGKR